MKSRSVRVLVQVRVLAQVSVALSVCVTCRALIVTGAETPPPIQVESRDWPWWRGPDRNGIADARQTPPTQWSETENIAWRVPVPGRGHSSPVVVGDQVVITTADRDRDVQTVLCFDRVSGHRQWEAVVHAGGQPEKGNEKSSFASSTAACDGSLYFVSFLNGDSAWTTAVSRDGKIVWQKEIARFIIHQGYGASPVLQEHLVIVVADSHAGGAVQAMNRATGETVWRRDRPKKPNYPSPVVLHVAGRDQLLLSGCDLVTSLNPLTGDLLWETAGATTECVTTTVTDGTRIFTSGGYPKNHIAAVAADGSARVVWENTMRVYVPSLLARDGHLFGVLDAGIAACLRSDTGEEVWKERIPGTFSASPVMVGDLIYATSEDGLTYVFRASAEKFELLAKNQLGESAFATPTICGDAIYVRAATRLDDQRQEFLACIRK